MLPESTDGGVGFTGSGNRGGQCRTGIDLSKVSAGRRSE
jgi:hypothetical protein